MCQVALPLLFRINENKLMKILTFITAALTFLGIATASSAPLGDTGPDGRVGRYLFGEALFGAVAAACIDVPTGTVTRPDGVALQWHGEADARRLANWATDYKVLAQESIAALPILAREATEFSDRFGSVDALKQRLLTSMFTDPDKVGQRALCAAYYDTLSTHVILPPPAKARS
jgi:hypothetical protein